MPRVGILVECGRDGLEAQVCPKICTLLQQETGIEIEPRIIPMVNKPRLLEECGAVTRNLLLDGCERVIILWDERPAWPDKREPLCWHNDRTKILGELQQANVAHRPVFLVCIEREFESWLLYDHQMLSDLLSTDVRPVRIGSQANPDRIPNPKGRMMSFFREHRNWSYGDVVYARRIAETLNSLKRLKKCKTFRRFAENVVGREL